MEMDFYFIDSIEYAHKVLTKEAFSYYLTLAKKFGIYEVLNDTNKLFVNYYYDEELIEELEKAQLFKYEEGERYLVGVDEDGKNF